MEEWANPYNSFNSYKGLLYRDKFDAIKNRSLTAPVEVNIDPVGNCQLNCVWCNGKNIINHKKKVLMSNEHLFDLLTFCKDWGVKGVCFAGGGEPSLHPKLGEAIEKCKYLGLEPAIITNGLFLNEEQMNDVALCRWIGVSVDAATGGTYKKLKGKDKLKQVLSNIEYLASRNAKEITFKFLVHPLNQHEILDACSVAKSFGATAFHARILSKKYIGNGEINLASVIDQFTKCRAFYEGDGFKVWTITHKQTDKDFRRLNFKKCNVSPLLCMFEANGDVSVCIDRKGEKETRLCSHKDLSKLRKMWGSKEHFELLAKINPQTDCKKCTLAVYQELYDAYIDDAFCVNFP